ncbi:MAG: C4-type zinc ribbon domain-containing protein [Deferribacteraceae bacterium]|jgi:predicted  nucleic acid-binding Zn-ribbon protein|nr:C4-type zinc ribbon domain-containing protein [Deferribacteraceae bacterium]
MVKETIEQFTRLQYFDTKIYEAEKLLAAIPEMLKERCIEYETLLEEKKSLDVSYNEVRSEIQKTEAENSDHKILLAGAQKKLTSVHNNREYEAALKELDNLKKSISDSDNKTRNLNEKAEMLMNAVTEKTEMCSQSENIYIKEKKEKEEENKGLFEEVAILKKERDAFAATVKKSILSKYERVRSARNNLAITPVNNETCSGCNMKIPPQLAVDVKKEKELFQCPYCQRFLYNPKIEAKAS